VTGLIPGVTYYFAVTAYTAAGIESSFSGEISYTVPAAAANLELAISTSHRAVLRGTGPAGYQFQVLASQDLKAWSAIGSLIVSSNGSFQFGDPGLATTKTRYYRLKQIAP